MNALPSRTASRHAARIGFVAAGLLAPVALSVAALVVMLVVGPSPAATVIVHWGTSGAEGWGPAGTFMGLVPAVGVLLPLLVWACSLLTRRIGDTLVLLAAAMVFVSLLLGVAATWLLLAQPADAFAPLLVSTGVGIAGGLVVWFLLPREPAAPPAEEVADPLPLADGELAAWNRAVPAPPGLLLGFGGAALLSLAAAAWLIWREGWAAWPALLLPVLFVAVLGLFCAWRVSAGASGLVVRGWFGWPVFRVRLRDIAQAKAVQADPLAEFGGWGVRWAPGRFGIVVRRGEAIDIVRRNGRSFVVTVDDAATGAAVLAAYKRRTGE